MWVPHSTQSRKDPALTTQSSTKRRPLHRRTAVVATAVALFCGELLAAVPASADTSADTSGAGKGSVAAPGSDLRFTLPAGFTSQEEFLAVQDRLRGTADRLGTATEGSRRVGYAGIAVSMERRQVILYWQGALPRDVESLVESERRHAGVVVRPARYSRQQLANEAARMVGRSATVAGARVVRVSIPADGHGLDVGVENAALYRQRAATSSGGVELTIAEAKSAQPAYSRLADSPPFWGGARIVNLNADYACSSGFAINKGGGTAMLSAGHCGEVGHTFVNGNGTYTLGPVIEKAAQADTLVISASTAGRVYDADAWGYTSRPVSGTSTNYPGLYTCTEGAFSGGRCDIVVRAVDEWVWTNVGWLGPLVRAEQLQYGNAAGEGDSGGPVISLTGPNWSQLLANGTITALDPATSVSCTGEGNRVCGWRIWYADVNRALALHNATIRLG